MVNDVESEETSYLLNQRNFEQGSNRNKWKYITGGVVAGAALFSLGMLSGAGLALHSESSDLQSTTSALELMSTSTNHPGIEVSNKYISKSQTRPEYPWLMEGKMKGSTILEPFKVTTFNVIDAIDDNSESLNAINYQWSLERKIDDQNENEIDLQLKRRTLLQLKGVDQEEIDAKEPVSELVAQGTSSSFIHNFDQLGLHRLTLEATYESESGTSQVLRSTVNVVVKYIRKEIHSVDDEDRETLLSAWQVLMTTNDEDGVNEYGDDFMSFTRLSTEHNNLAADKTCDHLHDGMGFVPAHVSLTRLLEASLQSVDASVTLPYWEYTIDVEDVIANKKSDFAYEWRNIPMFTDKWFGSSDEVTGQLKDSIFVDLNLKGNEYSTSKNGYGLTRAPWNNLKTSSFTRFFGGGSGFNEKSSIFVEADQMSTCSVLQDTLVNGATTLSSFNGGAAGQAHGPIHMFTGGQTGTKSLSEHMTKIGFHAHGKEYNQYWGDGVTMMFLNIKALWRYDLWSCSDSCDESTGQSDCACSCDVNDIVTSPAYDALFSSYIESWNDADGNGGDGMMRGMLDLMCNVFPQDGGVVMGDHASSAAASDPSFWVMHGTVERYLQLMRIQSRFTSESWDSAVFASNVHPNSATCIGHAETDTLVFGDIDGVTYTNGEYYDYLDPSYSNTPYVYDNFAWDHCDALGYQISTPN
mmetsp:Transcript_6478/g.7865  ORF Transcript_6478/g.7865 Transcript_6478/m.7865 type:complete len:695 (-) Transcript_6478:164-2248(-)